VANRKRILTLNDSHAMRINKELAREIGFPESIVFLQLEYLVSVSGEPVVDGRRWTRQTLADLQEYCFPWWSTATISRILNRLQERNLIVVGHYNRFGYDRTQWFAIDEEGVQVLRSVAILQDAVSIFQSETPNSTECNFENDELKNGNRQNEATIQKETYKEPLETSSDEDAKKLAATTGPPNRPKGVWKASEDEAERYFSQLCESDPHGDALRRLSELMAAENQSGKVANTKVWNWLGDSYLRARASENLSEEAWNYGFEQAILRSAPNVVYVVKAAKSYRPVRAKAKREERVGGGASERNDSGITDGFEFLFNDNQS
jgi:DNA-binding PadR family transcriptional regulator